MGMPKSLNKEGRTIIMVTHEPSRETGSPADIHEADGGFAGTEYSPATKRFDRRANTRHPVFARINAIAAEVQSFPLTSPGLSRLSAWVNPVQNGVATQQPL